MDQLRQTTVYDNVSPAQYVEAWATDQLIPEKSRTALQSHVDGNFKTRDFASAVLDEFDRRVEAKKKADEFTRRIKIAEHNNLVSGNWDKKD